MTIMEIIQRTKDIKSNYVNGNITSDDMVELMEDIIHDVEYRWVIDRLEYWNSEERTLTKDEMQIANLYYKKYNK